MFGEALAVQPWTRYFAVGLATSTIAARYLFGATSLPVMIAVAMSNPDDMQRSSVAWDEVAKVVKELRAELGDLTSGVPPQEWTGRDRDVFTGTMDLHREDLAQTVVGLETWASVLRAASRVHIGLAITAAAAGTAALGLAIASHYLPPPINVGTGMAAEAGAQKLSNWMHNDLWVSLEFMTAASAVVAVVNAALGVAAMRGPGSVGASAWAYGGHDDVLRGPEVVANPAAIESLGKAIAARGEEKSGSAHATTDGIGVAFPAFGVAGTPLQLIHDSARHRARLVLANLATQAREWGNGLELNAGAWVTAEQTVARKTRWVEVEFERFSTPS